MPAPTDAPPPTTTPDPLGRLEAFLNLKPGERTEDEVLAELGSRLARGNLDGLELNGIRKAFIDAGFRGGDDPDRTPKGLVLEALAGLECQRKELDLILTETIGMPTVPPLPSDGIPEALAAAARAWRSEREEAAHLAKLCDDAHRALDGHGAPTGGTVAARIESVFGSGLFLDIQQATKILDAFGAAEGCIDARVLHVVREAITARAELHILKTRGSVAAAAPSPLPERMAAAGHELLDGIENDLLRPAGTPATRALRALLGVPRG